MCGMWQKNGSNQKLVQKNGYILGVHFSSMLSEITIKPLVEELQRLMTEKMMEKVEAA